MTSVRDIVAAHVERGTAPGAVVLVSRGGDVRVDAVGSTTAGGGAPMARDAIFRISSLTKPIAAAATLRLVDEGVLELDEPVDRLLPELADRTVLTRLDAPLEETEPARRPITVRDLLTLRMGFGFAVGPAPTYPIMDAARELELGLGPPKPATPHDPDDWLRRLASLPLMHQPGEEWMYPTGFAVLGVLLARAADQPLEELLRERILAPLGMHDTGFTVPASELHRLPPSYASDPETGALELYDAPEESQWSRPPAFPDAGGGLVSTAGDVLAFARMLLAGGTHGRKRILSAGVVRAMTTDGLTATARAGANAAMFLGDSGWGLGLEVRPSGRYGWFGGLGTSWYTDPAAELVVIVMTQRLPPLLELHDAVWATAR